MSNRQGHREIKGEIKMAFSKKTRQEAIRKVQEEELDLLVIGGGNTGAGLTLQAAASGMKVALFEMQDFSEGTSSRSTKLVHGGIRYLKTLMCKWFPIQFLNARLSKGLRPIYQNLTQCFFLFMMMREEQPLTCFRSK